MNINKKLMISTAHAAVVCAVVVTSSMNAHAGETPKITSETTTKVLTTLTDQEAQAVSQAAGRVLYHTEHAQLAIADKKKDAALKQINQGLKLLQIIKRAVPKYKVTTHIKASDISYKTSEDVAQRYVTVLNSSFVENVVMPVVQWKKTGMSHHHKSSQNPEEDYSMARRMTVTLDIALADSILHIAKADVKAGKLKVAGDALTEIQRHGVILRSVEVPLPLASAVDNLYLAQTEMSKKHYKNASITLKEASNDLKAYEKINGDTKSKSAHKVAKEIDKLTSKIDTQHDKKKVESLMKNAKDDIALWWRDVRSWM